MHPVREENIVPWQENKNHLHMHFVMIEVRDQEAGEKNLKKFLLQVSIFILEKSNSLTLKGLK